MQADILQVEHKAQGTLILITIVIPYTKGFRSEIISLVYPGISVRGGGGGGGGEETEFPRELGPPDREVGGTEFPVTPVFSLLFRYFEVRRCFA